MINIKEKNKESYAYNIVIITRERIQALNTLLRFGYNLIRDGVKIFHFSQFRTVCINPVHVHLAIHDAGTYANIC